MVEQTQLSTLELKPFQVHALKLIEVDWLNLATFLPITCCKASVHRHECQWAKSLGLKWFVLFWNKKFVSDRASCFPYFNSNMQVLNCRVTLMRTGSLPEHRSAVIHQGWDRAWVHSPGQGQEGLGAFFDSRGMTTTALHPAVRFSSVFRVDT